MTTDYNPTIPPPLEKQGVIDDRTAKRKKRYKKALNHPQVAKRLKQMPKLYRDIYRRAITGKSLSSATKAQCLECTGWVRKEVNLCTDEGCPLYPYRPYQEENEQD